MWINFVASIKLRGRSNSGFIMNDAPPLIRLAGVTKTFGDNQALRGVDLDVAKGDSLVLIGGSGPVRRCCSSVS